MQGKIATSADDLLKRYQEARELFDAKQYSAALTLCDEALSSPCTEQWRMYWLVSKAMNEYALGHFSDLEITVAELGNLRMTDEIYGRWLMLRGRLLVHRRNIEAMEAFTEAEALFGRLELHQDEAWAQLSAARLSLVLGHPELVASHTGRVTFAPYLVKARLLEAEAHATTGQPEVAMAMVADVTTGTWGVPDEVDLARSAYVRAACALVRGDLVEAGLCLGEARNKALAASQKDFELLNAVEVLRTQLELQGG